MEEEIAKQAAEVTPSTEKFVRLLIATFGAIEPNRENERGVNRSLKRERFL